MPDLYYLHSEAFCHAFGYGGEASVVTEFRFHAMAGLSDGGVVRLSFAVTTASAASAVTTTPRSFPLLRASQCFQT